MPRIYYLTFLFFCIACTPVFNQESILDLNISMNSCKKPVREILKEISIAYKVEFSYNPDLVPVRQNACLNEKNVKLGKAIELLFSDSSVCAKEVAGQVVLFRKDTDRTSSGFTVHGTVISESTGEPVQFAGIYITKTGLGTISDEEGMFELFFGKRNEHDTVTVSSVGYKTFLCPVSLFTINREIVVILEDSVYELSETQVLSYDHIEPLFWNVKNSSSMNYLLTFSTRHMVNGIRFASSLKEIFGEPVVRDNIYIWKNENISDIDESGIRIIMKYFRCSQCPLDNDFTVTIEVSDRKRRNLLYADDKRKILTGYFQNILNKSSNLGVDLDFIEERAGVAYLSGLSNPYTGPCFSFDKKGRKSIEGYYSDGLRDGEWLWRFGNGQEGKQVLYNRGMLDGTAVFWYANGQKRLEVDYTNGKKEGMLEYWYPDGTKRMEAGLAKNKLSGTYIFWYPNGQMAKKAEYRNGAPVSMIEWNKKGKVLKIF